MARHQPPIGDIDLADARLMSDENIVSGGAGSSGSSFSATGRLGGMRDTGDGVGSTGEAAEADDAMLGGMIDSGITTTLGDVIGSTSSADADGSALDPETPDDADDDNSDDGAVEEGSIESADVGSPSRDIERA